MASLERPVRPACLCVLARRQARRRARRPALQGALAAIGVIAWSSGCASDLERRFQAHIDYLASDALEGRGVGSRGIKLAADYIADQFAQIGLEPAGDDHTYFQTFPMTLRRTLTGATRLAFEGDPVDRKVGRDFIPFSFSSDEAFEGGVVFCGYGIHAPEKDREDFADVDLSGKVALMLRGEPPSWADENGYPTRYAMLRNKVYNAKDRGAIAVLLVNQEPAEGEKDELVEFGVEGADAYGIPAFHVTRAMVDEQLSRAGAASLALLQKRMDTGSHESVLLPNVLTSGQAVFEKQTAPTSNVLGMLRGRGPKADAFVVIGAHYDHLGIRKPMMRKFKGGKLVHEKREPQIHNGADDNASGTSGLIEIARMLAAREPLRRSVLFVAFTAEESGLHGSKYYVEHPVVPLDRTVAMLNLDMIGRMKPGSDKVEIFGVGCGKGFAPIVERDAASLGLSTAPSSDTGGRSDQASFVRRKIPSMHFFSGQHSDYHKPSDDSDKINAKDGARITSLVYRIARDLAMQEARPTFVAIKPRKEDRPGPAPTYRVVMGLAPGYGDDGKPGMAVEAVNPEGPADLAGMKAGDRVIRISGKTIANIYDYMAATRNNNPGDTIEVVVLRDGRALTLRVTLASAK